MATKSYGIKELMEFFPKRYQGLIMGGLLIFIIMLFDKLIDIMESFSPFLGGIFAFIFVGVIIFFTIYTYNWVVEE